MPQKALALSLIVACSTVLNSLDAGVPWPGKNAEEAFDLRPEQVAKTYSVQEIACTPPSNVLWPGESATFTFQIVNLTDQPLAAKGKAEVIQYSMTSPLDDVWTQTFHRVAVHDAVPLQVEVPAKGFADVTVTPRVPKALGAYVLVLDLPGHGRQFAAAFVRVPKAVPGMVQHPSYALDIRDTTEEMCALFQRLGIKGTRIEMGFQNIRNPRFMYQVMQMAEMFRRFSKYDITTIVTLGGASYDLMPLGRIRSHLNEKGEGNMNYPGDFTWLPEHDGDYQEFVTFLASSFGWPKGPINAVELWNEPWEGSSISGWGADLPRYREIYTRMALGVEAARKRAKVDVLLGGCCSSMNTEDKLFPDGKDTFLKWLDFTSIHYQPMDNLPALIPEWVERKHPNGAVRPWDTESWVANSEERVAAVIASMRAQGLTRTAGVLHDKVRTHQTVTVRTEKGTERVTVVQAWSPGTGIAAVQHFIGERTFKELLFKNGLPWVFVFNGLAARNETPNPDDGTVVIVGDLGGVYQRELCKFHSVYGLANLPKIEVARKQLAALPADAPKPERDALLKALTAAKVLGGAKMTFPDGRGTFTTFDFYGNPVPSRRSKIAVPLNGLGYFVRTNGKPGSFEKLLDALRNASVEGYEPLEIQARDLTAPIDQKPELRLTLTNILNRPVTGTLTVKLGELTLSAAAQRLTFAAHETKTVTLNATSGQPSEANTYPLSVTFDAGKDGRAILNEDLHVNLIARRTIAVDGKLEDWEGALPHTVRSGGDLGPNLTEKAWLPFVNFPEKTGTGLAVSYLAYDDNAFYFAAKVADDTPDGGGIRYANRDDDHYYYPEKSYLVHKDGRREELTWPKGVRRFTYRRNPDLPFGGDAIQIAFNVLPQEKKGLYAFSPGTMERFMVYKDTDYEYYLHPVAQAHGGGTEIWRLLAPGVPRKHFYPRQPKAEKDGGPVTDGKLAATQDGHTRIIECALPWTEIPDVKTALDAGQAIKFSFRVTDNKGPTYELAADRSVSKMNNLAFHEYWMTHWANEVEFGFE